MKDRITRRRFIELAGVVLIGTACAGCAAAATQSAPNTTGTSATGATGATATRRTCPKGMVNDPYPGRCHDYRDDDNDGYCDYSVSA